MLICHDAGCKVAIRACQQSILLAVCQCVQTSEAERIGINHVAKVLPAGNDRSADQCTLYSDS